MNAQTFHATFRRLCAMHGKPATKALTASYWDALHDRLTDAEFATACQQFEDAEFFPTPARLLGSIRTTRDAVVGAVATKLFDTIIATCQDYDPHQGTFFTVRTVRERLGDPAADVFQAAGGSPAFLAALQSPEQGYWVRKALAEAMGESADQPAIAAMIERHRPDTLAPPSDVALPPAKNAEPVTRPAHDLVKQLSEGITP